MSSSVWKMPDQKPEKENHIVLVGAWATCLWYGGEKPEEIFWENVKRWAYLEEIIAQADKAERLQKAVDLIANMEQRLCIDDPVDILDDVLKIAKDEIKQLIKETTNDK